MVDAQERREAANPEREFGAGTAEDFTFLVAIGASAGGLEPLERFFGEVPRRSGMAFVVIQHLSPSFKSLMDELLARHTEMTIHRVEDGMKIARDSVYLIPPGMEMTVAGGRLRLTEQKREDAKPQLPIDAFFHSVAADQGPRGIGIVMSGTGSDGSRGIKSIKEAGGLTLAQDQESAKFDGMPRSSIDTGMVDFVLPPEEMAVTILEYARDPAAFIREGERRMPATALDSILKTLRDVTELDFSTYKPATVRRRIERRVELERAPSLEAYAERLLEDHEEVHRLYRDLLIGVTRFFRDRDAFNKLESHVIPDLFKDCDPGGEIRVWVAGCASGEEAYSITILLKEFADSLDDPPRIRVFATDAHRASLEVASTGRYAIEALADVTPARLEECFLSVGGEFQVRPEIRQLITFAPHNLLRDAPFTRMDLVTCRNLLIYFQVPAQMRVLHLFHFSLRVGGVLFLGPSETVGALKPEFSAIDNHWRVYRKRRDVRLTGASNQLQPVVPVSNRRQLPLPTVTPTTMTPDVRLIRAYDMLLDQYVPAGVLTNDRREVIHTFGRARSVLNPPVGRITLDVLELVEPSLKVALGAAIQRAGRDVETVRYRHVKSTGDVGTEHFEICVRPLPDRSGDVESAYFLITIENEDLGAEAPQTDPRVEEIDGEEFDASEAASAKIRTLEMELQYTKENLQATIEELETSNEELNAANEELIASNEELQSTNEELHSVNEELYTVNSEYQRKITELTELTDDVNNLLSSTDIAVVFLDRSLCVRRFTPVASVHFSLREQDISRPLEEITHQLVNVDLSRDVQKVLESGAMIQRAVKSRAGTDLLLRVLPYLSSTKAVDGVVLTIVDTSLVAETRRELESATARFEAFMQHSPALKWALDEEGRYVFMNPKYESVMCVDARDAMGKRPVDVLQHQTSQAFLDRSTETNTLAREGEPIHFDIQVPINDRTYEFLVSKFVFDDADGRRTLGGSAIDITDLRRITSERDEMRGRLDLAMRGAGCGLWDWAMKSGELSVDGRFYEMLGYEDAEFPIDHRTWRSLVHPDDIEGVMAKVDEYVAGEVDTYRAPYRMRCKDGSYAWIVAVGEASERDAGGAPVRMTGINLDIDDLKQAETALEELNEELRENNTSLAARNHELDQFAHAASHDLRSPLRTVIGFTEIVEEELGRGNVDEARAALGRIEGAAERMGGLIDSLLLFASVGRAEMADEPVGLRAVMSQVVADLKPEIDEAGAEVTVDGELPTVSGDATMLRQLVQNLVSNAIKYRSPERPPQIIVSATDGAGDGAIRFSIADNGLGFDQKDAEQAFAPFQRLHSTRSARGSGIGLSICRRVVERHGGMITVISTPGEGSTFTVEFPSERIVQGSRG